MPKTKTCIHCNGQKYVWNDKTKKNDLVCPGCKGKGYIIIP